MGDLFLFFKNQLRTLVFVSWCYIQCLPCREKLFFGCVRGSDLLESCASKVRMWPLQPCHKAEPWQEQLPFTHFPSPGIVPRFGAEVSGERGSAEPHKHQQREVSSSYSPCAKDGMGFFPSADEFITWEDAGSTRDAPFICYLKAAPAEHQP